MLQSFKIKISRIPAAAGIFFYFIIKRTQNTKKEKTGAVFSFFVLRKGNILPSPQSLSLK